MASDTFKHDPLLEATTSIRLLEILPDTSNISSIKCCTQQFPISSLPEYSGVSYEWGIDTPSLSIVLSDKSFLIRPNLWNCMFQLRSHELARYYWIDAICIDQSNYAERNAQVGIMGDIYAGAVSTITWVGDSDRPTAHAIKFLKQDARDIEATYEQKPEMARDISGTVAGLLNRSYWRRLWIVQELVLAKSIIVLCGTDTIQWDNLERFIRLLEERERAAKHIFQEETESASRKDYDSQRDAYNENHRPHRNVMYSYAAKFCDCETDHDGELGRTPKGTPYFIRLLAKHYGSTQCLDIRDKVFGLLGIDKDAPKYIVNYSRNRFELYVDVMMACQRNYGSEFPATFVSDVLQYSLCLQSYSLEVANAIQHWYDDNASMRSLPWFAGLVEMVTPVTRVGASVPWDIESLSPQDHEEIRESLGLKWLNEARSACGEDFTAVQKQLLQVLATNEVIIVRSAFGSVPGPIACAWQYDLPTPNMTEVINDGHTQMAGGSRFFFTENRQVGCGCGSIEVGDILVQTFGSGAVILAIRKVSADEDIYRIIGRVYLHGLTDQRESHCLKKDKEISLTQDSDDLTVDWQGPETYWAPQVQHLVPVRDWPDPDQYEKKWRLLRLGMDIKTLADLFPVSLYMMDSKNEWIHEKDERGDRFKNGAVDKLYIFAAPSLDDLH